MKLDPRSVPSPCWVIDVVRLERNLERLAAVHERTGARLALALKGYAAFSTFDLCRRYLHGTAVSSVDEARLGKEDFGGTVHAYAPAYRDEEMPAWLDLASHLTFNSFAQWKRFRSLARRAAPHMSFGIRVNPEHSEVEPAIYDPCARYSRLGVTRAQFRAAELGGIDGFHLHACCGQGADVLGRVLAAFEARFGEWLVDRSWVNLGGGQRITADDYDLDELCDAITRFRARWDVEVWLEPGEAVALDAGVLVATVLDIVDNEKRTAILDTSAAAHMPDVLEMPYRPEIAGARKPGECRHDYRLGGLTCLAGDVIGDYSFEQPLAIGDRLVFRDMAHYTMVKTNTFNGVRLPSIALFDSRHGDVRVVREFDYHDFRSRLS